MARNDQELQKGGDAYDGVRGKIEDVRALQLAGAFPSLVMPAKPQASFVGGFGQVELPARVVRETTVVEQPEIKGLRHAFASVLGVKVAESLSYSQRDGGRFGAWTVSGEHTHVIRVCAAMGWAMRVVAPDVFDLESVRVGYPAAARYAPGYCYLSMFHQADHYNLARLGAYPAVADVFKAAGTYSQKYLLWIKRGDCYHVADQTFEEPDRTLPPVSLSVANNWVHTVRSEDTDFKLRAVHGCDAGGNGVLSQEALQILNRHGEGGNSRVAHTARDHLLTYIAKGTRLVSSGFDGDVCDNLQVTGLVSMSVGKEVCLDVEGRGTGLLVVIPAGGKLVWKNTVFGCLYGASTVCFTRASVSLFETDPDRPYVLMPMTDGLMEAVTDGVHAGRPLSSECFGRPSFPTVVGGKETNSSLTGNGWTLAGKAWRFPQYDFGAEVVERREFGGSRALTQELLNAIDAEASSPRHVKAFTAGWVSTLVKATCSVVKLLPHSVLADDQFVNLWDTLTVTGMVGFKFKSETSWYLNGLNGCGCAVLVPPGGQLEWQQAKYGALDRSVLVLVGRAVVTFAKTAPDKDYLIFPLTDHLSYAILGQFLDAKSTDARFIAATATSIVLHDKASQMTNGVSLLPVRFERVRLDDPLANYAPIGKERWEFPEGQTWYAAGDKEWRTCYAFRSAGVGSLQLGSCVLLCSSVARVAHRQVILKTGVGESVQSFASDRDASEWSVRVLTCIDDYAMDDGGPSDSDFTDAL